MTARLRLDEETGVYAITGDNIIAIGEAVISMIGTAMSSIVPGWYGLITRMLWVVNMFRRLSLVSNGHQRYLYYDDASRSGTTSSLYAIAHPPFLAVIMLTVLLIGGSGITAVLVMLDLDTARDKIGWKNQAHHLSTGWTSLLVIMRILHTC